MRKTYQDGWHDGFKEGRKSAAMGGYNPCRVGQAESAYPEHGAGSPPDADSFPERTSKPYPMTETTNTNAYRHESILMRLDEIAALLQKISQQLNPPVDYGKFYPIGTPNTYPPGPTFTGS